MDLGGGKEKIHRCVNKFLKTTGGLRHGKEKMA